MRTRWLTSLTIATLSLGHSQTARACSPQCASAVRVPAQTSMPANLVEFEVTLADPVTLVLHTATGEAVPAHVEPRGPDRVFVPDAPVAPGTELVLTYSVCPGNERPGVRQQAFVVTEAVEPAVRAASLEILERGIVFGGLEKREAAFVRVRYDAPVGTGAEHLMTHVARVDGHVTPVLSSGGMLTIELQTQCRPGFEDFVEGMCGGIFSAPPGVHTLEVESHRLGDVVDPPPVQMSIETVCPGDASATAEEDDAPDVTEVDAGSESNGPVTTDAAVLPEPKITDALGTTGVRVEDASIGSWGCALRGSGPAGHRLGVALGLLAMGALARRRR